MRRQIDIKGHGQDGHALNGLNNCATPLCQNISQRIRILDLDHSRHRADLGPNEQGHRQFSDTSRYFLSLFQWSQELMQANKSQSSFPLDAADGTAITWEHTLQIARSRNS